MGEKAVWIQKSLTTLLYHIIIIHVTNSTTSKEKLVVLGFHAMEYFPTWSKINEIFQYKIKKHQIQSISTVLLRLEIIAIHFKHKNIIQDCVNHSNIEYIKRHKNKSEFNYRRCIHSHKEMHTIRRKGWVNQGVQGRWLLPGLCVRKVCFLTAAPGSSQSAMLFLPTWQGCTSLKFFA